MSDDDNKIVIPIEVTGDEEARRKIENALGPLATERLNKLGISPEEFKNRGDTFKAETEARNAARPAAGKDRDSKSAPNLEQAAFGETNQDIGRSAEVVRLFREALHALHPAISEAGGSLGEMTALIRASTGGVVALAAAVGGLLVTALEKASDAAHDTANRLDTFSPSGGNKTGGGREAFHGLQETGKQVNEFATDLAAPFEQLLRINQNQPPGQQQSNAGLQEILANLVKGLQAERVDPEKGLGALTELLKSVREKGFVTGDSLKALEDIAPRLSATLLQELNKLKPGAASFSDRQLLGASRAAGPKISSDLEQTKEDYPDSISTAWHNVKTAADRIGEATNNGSTVSRTLNGFADFLDLLAEGAKRFNKFSEKLAPTITAKPGEEPVPLPGYTAGPKDDGGPFDKFQPATTDLNAKAPNLGGLADSANKAADALDKISGSSEGTQKTLEDFARRQTELGDVSKDAAKKQSALDLKYEPAETASKIEKDKLAVDNSALRVKQAQLSAQEAHKAEANASLAPESAQESLNSANSNLRKAEHKFNQQHGLRDGYNQAFEDRSDSEDALDAAKTAVKRAKIEKRYAYLEPAKARLDAEKTKTEIHSAALEQRDSSLKLAKDEHGAPIAHELAQLRYAQAALDFDRVKIELLQKILEKLGDSEKQANEDVNAGDKKNAGDASGSEMSQDILDPSRKYRRKNNADQTEWPAEWSNPKPDKSGQDETPLWRPNGDQKPLGTGTRPVTPIDETQLYRPSYGEPKRSTPNPLDTGTRLNPLDNEQGIKPQRKDDFVGPNEQGFSGRQRFTPPPEPEAPAPLPRPRPPEAEQQPQASLEQNNQQVASLGSMLRDLISSTAAALNNSKNQDRTVTDPASGGIRGDNSNNAPDESGLSDAASSAKDSVAALVDTLRQLASASSDDSGTVHAAGGGYIRGPGTTTSDSINARLSDREYVHPADATEHYGVPFMDSIRTKKLPRFALGGMFGGMSRAMSAAAPSHSTAGRDASSAPQAAASKMDHWGTVDMRSDHGDFKMATERDTMRHLSSSAQKAKRYSTGAKPGWYGGTGQ